jgi:L-cysteine S-thiosulfotransferase
MQKTIGSLAIIGLACTLGAPVVASTPEEDKALFQQFFQERFPKVPLQDFGNGMYAIDAVSRENWEAIEEFPPYEPALS